MSVGFRSPSSSAGFRTSSSDAGFRSAGGGGGGQVVGKKKKQEEGFSLPVIGHVPGSGVLEKAAHDIKDVVYNMPAGLYYTGEAAVEAAKGHPEKLGQMAKGMVTQMYQDFRHPLRHPGLTLIDAMTVGSLGLGTAARFAEASRLAAVGDTAAATRTILRGFKPSPRMVTYNGEKVEVGQLSRAGGMRTIQKSLDRLRSAYPTAPIMGRSLEGRIAFHTEQQARLIGALETAPASEMMRYKTPLGFERLGRRFPEAQAKILSKLPTGKYRMSTPEAEAIRLVGEQTPIAERITYEQGLIDRGIGSAKMHENNIRILNIVRDRGYVIEKPVVKGQQARMVKQAGGFQIQYADGTWSKMYAKESTAKTQLTKLLKKPVEHDFTIEPNPKFPKIVNAVEQARAVAMHREKAAIDEGLLTPEEAYARKVAPLQEIRGTLPETMTIQEIGVPAVKGQARLFAPETLAPPKFQVANPDAMFRVPYARYETRGATRPIGSVRLGRGSQIGAKTEPGTFTHLFNAELLRAGTFRHDALRLMAETDLEAQRFIVMMTFKDKILNLAKATPDGMKEPVAIRMESVAGTAMPQATKALINKAMEPGVQLSSDEILALGSMYHDFAAQTFRTDMAHSVRPEQGYMWIERKVVRPFLEPEMLSSVRQVAAGGKTLRMADAANNAMRLGFLYLKPAYAIPNFFGNLALSLIQQGFMAPYNLYRSVLVNAKLGPLEAARLDAAMGEGMARAMASGGRGGLLGETTDVAAKSWGTLVDTPFRRASFLHEARRAGYTSMKDVRRLLTDKSLQDDLVRVALEANKEIVDFARLGPMESSVLRRVIFFYPWMKGSSVQFARLLTEHPAQGLVYTHMGYQGKQEVTKRMGGLELPSYLQGYFPVGGTMAHPTMINPAAASLFQSPGQAVETLAQTLHGGAAPGFSPFAFVNPVAETVSNTLTGVDPFTGQRITGGLVSNLINTMFGSMPAPLLYQRLTQDQSKKMFPLSPLQAIGQFTVGGALVPRTTSRARLYQATKRETQ